MNNLDDMQDLLDRAKSFRIKLLKPALDNSFIKDLEFNGVTNEIAVNQKDNVYAKCRITRKESVTGCIKIIKTKQKQIQVKILAGVVDGQELILKGAGNGYSDLIVRVIIK